jgi:hypothetical protein
LKCMPLSRIGRHPGQTMRTDWARGGRPACTMFAATWLDEKTAYSGEWRICEATLFKA